MKNKRILKFCILHFTFCILTLFPLLVVAAGIKDTKHNLSVSGPGTIRAVEETQICIFCHTPHNAYPDYPLWNHDPSAAISYTHYTSDTLQSYKSEAVAPPIDGVSKLCLSCHDGTIAVGAVKSSYDDILIEISACVDASGKLIDGLGCTGYIGTDLSGGHPLSIVFDEALKNKRNSNTELCHLNWPVNDPDVKLYPTHGGYGVQCSSCHDPHTNRTTETKDGKPWPPFWQKTTHDEVCLVCHVNCTHDWPW